MEGHSFSQRALNKDVHHVAVAALSVAANLVA
jgi:hypothetical protein